MDSYDYGCRMVDVSDVRVIPDHQEVYLDTETDQALIFEIGVGISRKKQWR